MTGILVSLDGSGGRLGALGVFEPRRGLRYLQVEPAGGPVRSGRIRGIAVLGERVYAVTQASLRIYALKRDPKAPLLELEREVVRNDWILGDRAQAGLHSVAVSVRRNRVYVGNHRDACLEELTLDGEFVARRYLWDMLPGEFPAPAKIGEEFDFGRIRGICTGGGDRLLVTVFGCNNTRRGIVLDADAGRVAAAGLALPIAGELAGDRLYVLNGRGRELQSFRRNGAATREFAERAWSACPDLSERGLLPAAQGMRGLVVDGDAVYCGIGNLRSPRLRFTAAAIAEFDAGSGALREVMFLPDLKELRWPKVSSMAVLPGGYAAADGGELVLYARGRRLAPKPAVPVAPATAEIRAPAAARVATVTVRDVGLSYRRQHGSWFGGRQGGRDFWALRNVSFTAHEGEALGIVGCNGSGKSSLCMLLAGTMRPDEGQVVTRGRVQLLALGVGFQVDLSGRENVYISGTLLGLTRNQIAEKIDDIVGFSELGDFIDEPVRTYSAGMRSRLAFAVATAIEPEILLLDEVMTAGDQSFSGKAAARLEAMRAAARTIIMVTHNLGQMQHACSRVIWLDRGRLLMDGEPAAVLAQYREFSRDRDRWLADHPEIVADRRQPAAGEETA